MILFSCRKEGKRELVVPLDCIDNILKKDSELGIIRNHACENTSLSKTIDNYVYSLQVLNYNECSTEFIFAFKAHQEAWLSVKKITNNYPDLRGEMHDLFNTINKTKDSTEFKILVKDIWDTWADVEKTAKLN